MKLEHGNLLYTIKAWANYYLKRKEKKKLSKNTIMQYMKVFDLFNKFIIDDVDENIGIKDIDKNLIIKFLNHEEWKTSTKKSYLGILKSLFKFISDENDSSYNFTKVFKNFIIKTKPCIPIHLSIDEINQVNRYCVDSFRIINQIRINVSEIAQIRNALLIYILLNSGVKVSECLSLRVDDFILDKDYHVYSFRVLGQNNKKRLAYVPSVIKMVLKYIKKLGYKNIAFSTTNKEHTIGREFLFVISKDIFKELQIDKTGLNIFMHSWLYLTIWSASNMSIESF